MNLTILAECYANKCIAEMILEIIAGELNVKRVRHNEKMGRDKVIAKAYRIGRSIGGDELLLIIIDYERGVARRYVDSNFNIKSTLYEGTVHIAISDKLKAVAIILDPDVEEFLCRNARRYCNEGERGELKRGNQNRVCGKLQNLKELNKILYNLTNMLLGEMQEMLRRVPTRG
jgi:hypothetical protein